MFLNESVVIDDVSAAKIQKLLLIVTIVSNFPLIIVGLGGIMLLIFIILLIRARKQKNEVKRIVFTKPVYATTAEDDTSYSPVSDKEKDDPQNGTYIGLTPKSDPQAWREGRKGTGRGFVHRQPFELQIGIWVFRRKRSIIENC